MNGTHSLFPMGPTVGTGAGASAVVVAVVIVVAFCFIEKPKCIQIKPQFLYLMDE